MSEPTGYTPAQIERIQAVGRFGDVVDLIRGVFHDLAFGPASADGTLCRDDEALRYLASQLRDMADRLEGEADLIVAKGAPS